MYEICVLCHRGCEVRKYILIDDTRTHAQARTQDVEKRTSNNTLYDNTPAIIQGDLLSSFVL